MFPSSAESHEHSLEILNALYEYDDFMESIRSLVDIGCGDGLDLEWWATRTTRDDRPEPLNIQCTGVDLERQLPMSRRYPNITYQPMDFEESIFPPKQGFDILWCHNSFQYALSPIATLSKWWHIAAPGAMLAIMIPQTTNVKQRQLEFTQEDNCYYHYTLVNLIHMLAVNGWDCNNGFFKKTPNSPWISAIVYKSEVAPMNPKTTSWHTLSELKLLPETADKSIHAHGYLRQEDLVLPWLDHNLIWMGKQ